jgi:hypothetical protein
LNQSFVNNSKYLNSNRNKTWDDIEGWLSFISIIISIIFLVVTLFTYMLFKKLRNLPGWIITNLTFALLLAQSSFFIGTFLDNNVLGCFIIAIFTHYSYLTVFFWMNISAFDLYRNFRIQSSHILLQTINLKERLPVYMIYAWFSPAVIVSFSLTIDFLVTLSPAESIRPCYASYLEGCKINQSYFYLNQTEQCNLVSQFMHHIIDSACYIENGKANLLFFGLPIGFIICLNGIFFALTICNIRKMKKKQKSITKRASKGKVASDYDIKFYIQMSILMGFTWISGYTITPQLNHDVITKIFSVLFIISNGFTGIFIFFAFIFSKNVLNLYKDLIFRKKEKKCQKVYSIKLESKN